MMTRKQTVTFLQMATTATMATIARIVTSMYVEGHVWTGQSGPIRLVSENYKTR